MKLLLEYYLKIIIHQTRLFYIHVDKHYKRVNTERKADMSNFMQISKIILLIRKG